MRISDWSSDVCSSDLGAAASRCGTEAVAEAGAATPGRDDRTTTRRAGVGRLRDPGADRPTTVRRPAGPKRQHRGSEPPGVGSGWRRRLHEPAARLAGAAQGIPQPGPAAADRRHRAAGVRHGPQWQRAVAPHRAQRRRPVARHGRDRDDRAGTAAATNPRYVPAGTTRGTGTGAVHAALRERFAISLRMRLAGSRAEATSRMPSAHPHARLRGETVGVEYRHRVHSGTIRAPGGVAAVRWCRYRAAVDRKSVV